MNQKEPLVSIIIPTFNRAHLIRETLDSIIAQTYKNWECIIVDDGSSDETDEVMLAYCENDTRFRYYHRPDKHLPGGNGARNYGFEKSRGDYIQWFDSDDLMMPEKLELKILLFQKQVANFVVCEGGELIDWKDLSYKKKWKPFKSKHAFKEHVKGNLVFGTNGPMFRKSYLEEKLLFDEELIISQEWEFFSRLLLTKPDFEVINKVLYVYRNEIDGKRNEITQVKFKNRIKAYSKIVQLINTEKRLDTNEDFEVRKLFFSMFKLWKKRAINFKYYKQLMNLVGFLNLIITKNFMKTGFNRIKNKPGNLFKVFK